MALKDIEIKFSAKGDDVLIQTIQKLDRATKALVKAQSALAGEGKKKIGVDKANLNSLRKLNIELKLQGKNLKAVGLDTNLYSQALKGNKLSMAKIRAATKKYNLDLKKTRKGLLDTAHSTRILGGSFAVLRSKLLIASFAMMLVERTVVSLVKSFAKQEAVNQKLRTGLANIADTTEGVTQRLIDYSSALQKTTAFGDELITNGMVQLTTFGLNEEAIKSLTPQVLNVARAIQTTSGQMPDLNSLFIAFGKSTSTAVSALTRYGVVLTDAEKAQLESMGANERATAIAKILDKQYGGLAEAYARTTMGMLEAASAARGDAAEAFGEVLAPAVLAVSEALKEFAESIDPEDIKQYATGLGIATVATAALALATGRLTTQIIFSSKALVRSGYGTLIVLAGILTAELLDLFGVFESGDKVLGDHNKLIQELNKTQQALIQDQKDSAKSLKERYDALIIEHAVLVAKSDIEKELAKTGHQVTFAEIVMMQLIIDKTEAIRKERLQQEMLLLLKKEDMSFFTEWEQQEIKKHELKRQDIEATKELTAWMREQFVVAVEGGKKIESQESFFTSFFGSETEISFITKRQRNSLNMMKQFSGTIATAVINGQKMGDAVVASLKAISAQIIADAAIYAVLTAMTGGTGGAFASSTSLVKFLFGHDGGEVTSQGIKRYHSGGLARDEVPAILQQGEFVLSKQAVQSIGLESAREINRGDSGGTVNVYIQGGIVQEDYVVNELLPAINKAKALA